MTARRVASVMIGIGAAVTVGLLTAGYLGGLRVNLTPSYPLGLWRIVPLQREAAVGDLVFICPPSTPVFVVARERGYLRSGLCPGWLSPLIKTVVAIPGQWVEVVASTVNIGGTRIAHSRVRRLDAEGRALVPYAGGVVPAGQVFLHSPFSGSYDSRYFGPVPATGLLGFARSVLTFTP